MCDTRKPIDYANLAGRRGATVDGLRRAVERLAEALKGVRAEYDPDADRAFLVGVGPNTPVAFAMSDAERWLEIYEQGEREAGVKGGD